MNSPVRLTQLQILSHEYKVPKPNRTQHLPLYILAALVCRPRSALTMCIATMIASSRQRNISD